MSSILNEFVVETMLSIVDIGIGYRNIEIETRSDLKYLN